MGGKIAKQSLRPFFRLRRLRAPSAKQRASALTAVKLDFV